MRVELATRLGNYRRDPLYRNSFAITLSGIIGSLFGLLFWLAAARLMSTAEVGLGTAIISVIVLITSLAMLGMDIGLTRYLPETTDKSALYSTTFVVTFCVSIVITSIFLAGLSFFSPSLLFLRQGWYSLSLFSVIGAVSVYQLAYTALIASRRGDLSLFQNLSLGLRVPLLLFIYPFGVLAIYSAYGAAYFVALVIGSLLLINQGISLNVRLCGFAKDFTLLIRQLYRNVVYLDTRRNHSTPSFGYSGRLGECILLHRILHLLSAFDGLSGGFPVIDG